MEPETSSRKINRIKRCETDQIETRSNDDKIGTKKKWYVLTVENIV